jgi:hypothetical protein
MTFSISSERVFISLGDVLLRETHTSSPLCSDLIHILCILSAELDVTLSNKQNPILQRRPLLLRNLNILTIDATILARRYRTDMWF